MEDKASVGKGLMMAAMTLPSLRDLRSSRKSGSAGLHSPGADRCKKNYLTEYLLLKLEN